MQTVIKKNIIKAFGREVVEDVRELHDETGDVIVEHQTRLVPVDKGDLRSTIRKEQRGPDVTAILEGNSEIDYPLHQEYGTDRQSGTPHIRPAFQLGVRHLINGLGRLRSKHS